MELEIIQRYLSYELAIMFFLTTVALLVWVRKLKKAGVRVVKVPQKTKKKDSDEQSVSYLTFLNQAILATELRMEEESDSEDGNIDEFDLGGELTGPLSLRRAFLEVEVTSIEESGEDGDAYWSCQEKRLQEIWEKISSRETTDDVITEDIVPSGDVEALTKEIEEVKSELDTQIKVNEDMQPYKRLLYDLAGQVRDVTEVDEPVAASLSGIKDKVDSSVSIDALINSVVEEHSKLTEILGQIGKNEDEIDESVVNSIQAVLRMRSKKPKEKVVFVDQSEHRLRKEVDKLRNKTHEQQGTIEDLKHMLEDGDGAGESNSAAVSEKMGSLEAMAKESEMCITVLEEENQSRQEQLEDLLMTIDGLTEKAERAVELEEEIKRLTDVVGDAPKKEIEMTVAEEKSKPKGGDDDWMDELQEANHELSEQIADIRNERDQLVVELTEKIAEVDKLTDTIKRFSSETGDVMNSVVTLEDLNDKLMNEIDELKKENEEAHSHVAQLENQAESSAETEEKEMTDDDIEALMDMAVAPDNEVADSKEEIAKEVTEENISEDEIEALLNMTAPDANTDNIESTTMADETVTENKSTAQIIELEERLDSLANEKIELESGFHEMESKLEESVQELSAARDKLNEKEFSYGRLKKEFIDMETNLLMRM